MPRAYTLNDRCTEPLLAARRNHRERYAGTAKYGIGNRMWKGLRDCFAMRWVRARLLTHEVGEEL